MSAEAIQGLGTGATARSIDFYFDFISPFGFFASLRIDDLAAKYGTPYYVRLDAPASPAQKAAFKQLTGERVAAATLAGDPIVARLTRAPGNDAPIGGLKVVTESAWFAARPSGTEDVYKIYAESFRGPEHLAQVQAEAKDVVSAALTS